MEVLLYVRSLLEYIFVALDAKLDEISDEKTRAKSTNENVRYTATRSLQYRTVLTSNAI